MSETGASLKDLFGRFGKKKTAAETSIHPIALDSELIVGLRDGQMAIEALRNPEISGTTRREVWDRLLRAAGTKAFMDTEFQDFFRVLEKQGQDFYKQYFADGTNLPSHFDPDISAAVSGLPIINKNRNLAAKEIEGAIRERTIQAYEQFAGSSRKPVVVSTAFGGNEPALLLSFMFGEVPLHLKPPPGIHGNLQTHWIGDPQLINGRDVILVEDTVKTGDTIAKAKKHIELNFNPRQITELIIKPNPFTTINVV